MCGIQTRPEPIRSFLALTIGRGWCPESDLNQRPTAYEAVALPLSYRGSRLRARAAYLADCHGRAKALGASRRVASAPETSGIGSISGAAELDDMAENSPAPGPHTRPASV